MKKGGVLKQWLKPFPPPNFPREKLPKETQHLLPSCCPPYFCPNACSSAVGALSLLTKGPWLRADLFGERQSPVAGVGAWACLMGLTARGGFPFLAQNGTLKKGAQRTHIAYIRIYIYIYIYTHMCMCICVSD